MDSKSCFARTVALCTSAALGACVMPPTHRAPDAAYVVLGDDGAALARVLVADYACPRIEIDGRAQPMTVRAPFSAIASRPAAPPKDGATAPAMRPSPVLTCEAALPPGTARASVAGQALPPPKPAVRRIVVIGDTGCRIKGKEVQDCNDPDAYPFARAAAAAAAWKPDLVVHVGDYHYREDPCPADRPGCAFSPWGYGYAAWHADFFAPARPLLAAAPWVMVRGNHETCARAGQGWWRFLDPHPLVPGRDCNDPRDDGAGDDSEPYAVSLGPDAQLLVFDTANTSYKGFAAGDARIDQYRATRRKLDALAARKPVNLAADHHPLLAFGAVRDAGSGAVRLFGGDAGLIQAFGADGPLLPAGVDVLLSGHVHLWEQASFASDHPTQFVSGFSGTAEDIVPLPASAPPGAAPAPGSQVEALSSWIDGFGFMTMERTGPRAWTVAVHDLAGRVRNTCRVEGRHSRCAVAQVPRVD
jgi:hypothetical protein